uniref:hypothetical protein n=1 Tax=Aliarcobacter sp. TaxID=2321116 RepID=UPI0040471E2E
MIKTFSLLGFFFMVLVFVSDFFESAAIQRGAPLSPETIDNMQLGMIIFLFLLASYIKSKSDEKKKQ